MAAKRWVHVEMVVEHSATFDLMVLAEGRALAGTFHMRPVKHGGESEDGGKLKEVPTARQFMMLYISEHPRFKVRDACEHAVTLGITKGAIHGMCFALMKEGYLKRAGTGEYETTVRGAKPKNAKLSEARKDAWETRRRNGHISVPAKIAEILSSAGGELVNIRTIKARLKQAHMKFSGVSPALADMLSRGQIERPEKGMYRIVAPQVNSEAHPTQQ